MLLMEMGFWLLFNLDDVRENEALLVAIYYVRQHDEKISYSSVKSEYRTT